MAKVKLGEVARECKSTVKESADLPNVGLEHLIPGEIELTQWSESSDNTFTKGFKKGQMLFGRRRAYLKKAAVAPFDGICSGDITVIEAIPEKILPELLPFVIQNDRLFDYAVEKSAGSLSPRVKWEHLKNFEFELPKIRQQKELVDLLWAMIWTKKAYQNLVNKTDELVKSQFIERFIKDERNSSVRLDAVTTVSSGLTKNAKRPTFEIKMPYLRVANVFFDYIDLDDVQTIGVQQGEIEKSLLKKGDILFVEGNGSPDQIGRVAVWDGQSEPMLHQNHIIKARPDERKVLPRYCMYFFMTQAGRNQILSSAKTTSGLYTLSLSKIAGFKLPLAPLEEQQRFLQLVEQSDKSKFELKQAIARIDDMIKALM